MYQIKNYAELYMPTNSKGGDLINAKYVKLPVNPRGKGLRFLLKRYKDGIEIFGIWALLLEAATETTKPELRGKLLNHRDEPASIQEISESISMEGHEKKVENAISALIEVGWIEYVQDTESVRTEYGQSTDKVPPKISKDKISKDNEYRDCEIFEKARELFKGTKRGIVTEFNNYKKHHDWKEVLPLLEPAIKKEIAHKKALKEANKFCPQWADFQTWINQRRWEQEFDEQKQLTETTIDYQKRAYEKYKKEHAEFVMTAALETLRVKSQNDWMMQKLIQELRPDYEKRNTG
jgi:hypothetical protein